MAAPILGQIVSRLGLAARAAGGAAVAGVFGKESQVTQAVNSRLGRSGQKAYSRIDPGFTFARASPTERKGKARDKGEAYTSQTVSEAVDNLARSFGHQADLVSEYLSEAGEAALGGIEELGKQVQESLTKLERALQTRDLTRRTGSAQSPGLKPQEEASGEAAPSEPDQKGGWKDVVGGLWGKTKGAGKSALTKGKGIIGKTLGGIKGLAGGLAGGIIGTLAYTAGEKAIDYGTGVLGESLYGKEKMDRVRQFRETGVLPPPAAEDRSYTVVEKNKRYKKITFRATDMFFDFGNVIGVPKTEGDAELMSPGSPEYDPSLPNGGYSDTGTAPPKRFSDTPSFSDLTAPTGTRPLQATGPGGSVQFSNPFSPDRGIQPAHLPTGGGNPIEKAASMLGASENKTPEMVREYLRDGGVNLDPQQLAWCAAFVNASLAQSGMKGTGSNMAKSFLNWGEPTDNPQKGDIVVFDRGGTSGHVGFFDGFNENGTIRVLGGNQGPEGQGKVSYANYSTDLLLGYRRVPSQPGVEPRQAPIEAHPRNIPAMADKFFMGGKPQPSGFVGTAGMPPPPPETEAKKKIVLRRPGQKWEPDKNERKKKKEEVSRSPDKGSQVTFSEYMGVDHNE